MLTKKRVNVHASLCLSRRRKRMNTHSHVLAQADNQVETATEQQSHTCMHKYIHKVLKVYLSPILTLPVSWQNTHVPDQ